MHVATIAFLGAVLFGSTGAHSAQIVITLLSKADRAILEQTHQRISYCDSKFGSAEQLASLYAQVSGARDPRREALDFCAELPTSETPLWAKALLLRRNQNHVWRQECIENAKKFVPSFDPTRPYYDKVKQRAECLDGINWRIERLEKVLATAQSEDEARLIATNYRAERLKYCDKRFPSNELTDAQAREENLAFSKAKRVCRNQPWENSWKSTLGLEPKVETLQDCEIRANKDYATRLTYRNEDARERDACLAAVPTLPEAITYGTFQSGRDDGQRIGVFLSK